MSLMSDRLQKEQRIQKDMPVVDYFQGNQRVFDTRENIHIVKIFAGDWYVSTQNNEMMATVLGSCVSACIRDPVTRIGGMNHFLLPGDGQVSSEHGDAARYGTFAMENLINGIMKSGGRKDRLEIKVFGGGNVINNSSHVGSRNAEFIRNFLKKEGFKIAAEDLEGNYPRRVHYYPYTGKVMMRVLKRKEDMVVVEVEARYNEQINVKPLEGNIELF